MAERDKAIPVDAAPKARRPNQTVCDEPGPKDDLCLGHLKVFSLAPRETLATLSPGRQLLRCQRCLRLYEGEPMSHLH